LSQAAIITDIDGTILEKGFPVDAVISYIVGHGADVIVLTNRPDSDRVDTEKQLADAGLAYSVLLMNPGSDPASVFKKSSVQDLIDNGIEPMEFIDDSLANRNAVKSLGIKVTDPADIIKKADRGEHPETQSLDCRVGSILKQMTLEQSLKALKAAFTSKTGEAEAMSKEMADLKASNISLKEQLKAASSFMEAAKVVEAQRDEAIAKIEEITKSLAVAEATKVEAVKQIETAGKKAASIAASVGVTPVEISAADSAVSKTPEEVWNEYLAIKNPAEKLAFYNKNRASIVAHLGVK
jgi:hypothetical protein